LIDQLVGYNEEALPHNCAPQVGYLATITATTIIISSSSYTSSNSAHRRAGSEATCSPGLLTVQTLPATGRILSVREKALAGA